MGEQGRRLLSALAKRGMTRADELELTQAELAAAVDELGNMVDDDNQKVHVVRTWHDAERITAVELTPTGRGLAAHAR